MTIVLVALVLGAGASGISAGSLPGRLRPTARPEILFGLGPEADKARSSLLAKAAPVQMLSSWFNGTSDLSWISLWKNTQIPRDYAAGYAVHLIVWSGEADTRALATPYGTACGRAYP